MLWQPRLAQMRAAQAHNSPSQFSSNAHVNVAPNPALQAQASGGYNPEWQHEQLCEFLDTIISVPHLNPAIRDKYVDVLGRMVSLVINGALALDRFAPVLGKLDPERAGICMFRY